MGPEEALMRTITNKTSGTNVPILATIVLVLSILLASCRGDGGYRMGGEGETNATAIGLTSSRL